MPAQGDRAVHVQKLSVASVVIAAVAFSVPARAADMAPIPVAPIPIALPFDWEGFYVGARTGAATDDVRLPTSLSWFRQRPREPVWVLRCSQTVASTPASPARCARPMRSVACRRGTTGCFPDLICLASRPIFRDRHQFHRADEPAPGDPSAVAQWNDKLTFLARPARKISYIAGPWLFYATGGFAWELDKFTRTRLRRRLRPASPSIDPNALQGGAAVTATHLRAGWSRRG